MNITVFLERKNETKNLVLEEKMTVAQLLQKAGVNSTEAVVARNGEVVTEDAVLKDGDSIKVFSVVSGG